MPLLTEWADHVDPDDPLPDHPRPQLVRDRWTNLNGRWEAAVHAADAPAAFTETIVVPFPMGSALSGIERVLQPDQTLTVRRTFTAPRREPSERLRVHFGAVDWSCEVRINGRFVGEHAGGFDPFHFDITDSLVDAERQEIEVAIRDPTDTGPQPLGKQTLNPFAIQYTAYAGIWQTVWLEPVPAECIEAVVATTRLGDATVTVTCRVSGAADAMPVAIRALAGTELVSSGATAVADGVAVATLSFDELRRWSPTDPYLHDLEIELGPPGEPVDRVDSYFGAREVGTVRDADGHLRLTLNDAPVFHLGPLDQGWWPDGLSTAPTDDALAFDIEATLAMGFNTIRKHVKVEPARWYWHADRLGVMVWQDMPSTRFDMVAFGTQLGDGVAPPDMPWHEISPGRDPVVFRAELDAMIDALEPFTSIVAWVPFNESWGQHDTDATLAHVATRDPSRLVDGPSGWVDTGSGDIRDHHVYRDPGDFPGTDPARPVVYGEYGGLKLAVAEHMWADGGWGYETTETPEELEQAYSDLTGVIASLVPQGLAGAIYTQTTDVEGEINGLLTYDRRVWKIPAARLAEIHAAVGLDVDR